jgi:predicted lipoprotein with Yx(FWY)xxD motif
MKRLLIYGAAALAVLVALAACGGGGAGDGGTSAGSAASGSTTVSVAEIGEAGSVLVDADGQALYVSDEEAGGEVVCTDACASFWVPLTIDGGAPTGDSLPGELGVAERPEGTRQVTYDGRRLYTFVRDETGEVTGEGFSDAFAGQVFTWHVVHPDGSTGLSEGGSDDGGFSYGR